MEPFCFECLATPLVGTLPVGLKVLVENGHLKNIFGSILLVLTHVVYALKRDCDVDRLTDMSLEANNKKYPNFSLANFKLSSLSWLESLKIKRNFEGCNLHKGPEFVDKYS